MCRKTKKMYLYLAIAIIGICCLTGCSIIGNEKDSKKDREELKTFINSDGTTLKNRINTPNGYKRTLAEPDSLATFLREFSLKEDGSKVLLYNGEKKKNQNKHVAVFNLSLSNEDLQQCADSVMRMYAEYFWKTEQYDKIAFHFVSGFLANYEKWREGYRIEVNGNDVSWVKTAEYDDSYETFQDYMRIVFTYASTLSLKDESTQIVKISDIQAGDIFLKAGSPGHVVMIVDICENEQGKKAFLLAQGYMPAQEFHIIKNPTHKGDPWYYEDEVTYPFKTAEYTFEWGNLRQLKYLNSDWNN